MTVTWNELSSDEQQALERLFTHDSFPVPRETANRLVNQGLAKQKLGGVDISPAGEDLVMQHRQQG